MGYPIWNRRRFLRTAAGTAGFLAAMPYLNAAEALTDARPLKVGLVGCGGRGLGAMKNALDADPGTVVWALADVFQERIDFGSNLLTEQYGSRVQLDKSRLFDGLDGYKKLLQTDIDVVLLCTPPAFRPEHVAAAIDAGKHIYAEKPVAVDVPGVLSVLESARLAKLKNLVILDGFCWRYDKANEEAHRKLSSGELGRVLSFDGLYYTTPPKSPLALDSRPSSDTDVAWALRNWTAWNWLSGGQFVEQIVHTIDGMVWSMNEQLPLAAFGSGGRALRRDDGDVWDHYDVYFEYDHNVAAHISCRQWVGCHGEIVDRTVCEKGCWSPRTAPISRRINAGVSAGNGAICTRTRTWPFTVSSVPGTGPRRWKARPIKPWSPSWGVKRPTPGSASPGNRLKRTPRGWRPKT